LTTYSRQSTAIMNNPQLHFNGSVSFLNRSVTWRT